MLPRANLKLVMQDSTPRPTSVPLSVGIPREVNQHAVPPIASPCRIHALPPRHARACSSLGSLHQRKATCRVRLGWACGRPRSCAQLSWSPGRCYCGNDHNLVEERIGSGTPVLPLPVLQCSGLSLHRQIVSSSSGRVTRGHSASFGVNTDGDFRFMLQVPALWKCQRPQMQICGLGNIAVVRGSPVVKATSNVRAGQLSQPAASV
ncbi:hypothetical protein BCR34DRAFT_186183 [Clohesyomyces aquaticus]|uniref:Uncharacterized protein n=1 Tax=Clohesyomyces aquaticus TaxID=1231657 RepID=A0A1Y1YDI6_9PLEO|nr:hypothetical protein BCR34DRAFT_186183 [Clohesyomyces aquaticus]